MSILAAHEDREREQAWRACLEQRPRLLDHLHAQFPAVGSLEIEEAVDTAMTELLEKNASPDAVARMWPQAARRRVIDASRAPRVRRRDIAPVEQHHQAHEDQVSPAEEIRSYFRVAELLEQLTGDERRWARMVLSAPDDLRSPRYLSHSLGWPAWRYRRVANRARAQVIAFIAARADGTVCNSRQAVLGAFTAMHLHGGAEGELDVGEYRRTLLHVQGCPSCQAQWREQERALRDARHALLPAPLLLGLLTAAKTRLAATLISTRVRLGGAGAGAGGAGAGAAALGGKGAALICAGVMCAAGAGGALISVAPTILAHPSPPARTGHTTPQVKRHHHDHHGARRHARQRPLAKPRHTLARAHSASLMPPPASPSVSTPPSPSTPASAAHSTQVTSPTRALHIPPRSTSPQQPARRRHHTSRRHDDSGSATPGDLPLTRSASSKSREHIRALRLHARRQRPHRNTVTPGDLSLAAQPAYPAAVAPSTSSPDATVARAASTTSSPAPPSASSTPHVSHSQHAPGCTPGDLAC